MIEHPLVNSFRQGLRRTGSLSECTIQHYGHDVNLLLRYVGRFAPEVTLPGGINREIVGGFLKHLSERRGNSDSSRRRRLASIKRFMAFCKARGMVGHDPTATLAVNAPSRGERPVDLTLLESRQFLEAARTTHIPERDYAIFYLFLTCGCTLSELILLECDDVDLGGNTITVRSRNRTRSLPLSPGCRKALTDHLDARPKAPADRQLFLNRYGHPITKGAVYHAFGTITARVGLKRPGLSIRSLRHSCFVLLRDAGLSLHCIRNLAGYKSIASTKRFELAGEPWERRPRSMQPWVHPIDDPTAISPELEKPFDWMKS